MTKEETRQPKQEKEQEEEGLPCPWSNDVVLVLSDDDEDETTDTGTINPATNSDVSTHPSSPEISSCLSQLASEDGGIIHPAFWDEIMETFQSMLIANAMNDIVNFNRSGKSVDRLPHRQQPLQRSHDYTNSLTRSQSLLDRNNNVRRTREVNWIPYDEMELVRNPAFDMEDEVYPSQQSNSNSSNNAEGDEINGTALILPTIARTGSSVQRYLENVQLTAPTALSTWPSSEEEEDEDDEEDSEEGTVPTAEPDVFMDTDTASTTSSSPTSPTSSSGHMLVDPYPQNTIPACATFSPLASSMSSDDNDSSYGNIRQSLSCPR
ncbi:hypothetical protein ACA910_011716 [Epithemia clementina (nom. ined.)]